MEELFVIHASNKSVALRIGLAVRPATSSFSIILAVYEQSLK